MHDLRRALLVPTAATIVALVLFWQDFNIMERTILFALSSFGIVMVLSPVFNWANRKMIVAMARRRNIQYGMLHMRRPSRPMSRKERKFIKRAFANQGPPPSKESPPSRFRLADDSKAGEDLDRYFAHDDD